MRDYGKMFLGLILAGIVLIVIGLWLVSHQPRNNDGQARPALSALPIQANPGLFATAKTQ